MTIGIALPVPSFASPESVNAAASIKADMAALETAQQDHESKIGWLREAVDWTPDKEQQAQSLHQEKISLLQKELALYVRAESLLATIAESEQPKAKQAAFESLESAKQSVVGALVGAGFIDGPIESLGNRHGMGNGHWVGYHPSVIAARATFESISNHDNRAARSANAVKADSLRSRIGQAITNATSSSL